MKVIKTGCSDFANLWNRLWQEDATQHPFGSFLNTKYAKAYATEAQYTDRSFVVVDQDGPVMGVQLALAHHAGCIAELSAFGRPLIYLQAPAVTPDCLSRAGKLFKEEMMHLFEDAPDATIRYCDVLVDGKLSFLGQLLLDNASSIATPLFTQIVSLSPGEEVLKRHVRKSYKSLIHWGLKHLNINVLDSQSLTRDDIERFRQLHIQEAGRETRSVRTWEIQFEQVLHGEAFVVFGELDEQLVTAAFFLHSEKYCYYGVSASVRAMFDKPLSHAILWTALLHARKLGCAVFEFGEQLFPSMGNPTLKELGISLFKKGFGGDTCVRLNIQRAATGWRQDEVTKSATNDVSVE